VLGALATSEQVGFYSVALSTAEAAMSIGPWVVAAIFFPLLVTDWAGADRAALAARYQQCVRYLALAAATLALGGIVVADAIVAVVFGSAYSPMVPALQVVLVAAAAAALAQGPSSVLAAAERQDWLVRVRMPLAAANILLNIALVPRFAAVGAAWANLAVATTEALVLGVLAWRLGAPVPGSGLLLPFVSAGAAAAAAALVIRDRTDPVALAMSIVVAIPVYFGVLIVFRFFRPEDAVVIRPLLARLRHPSTAVCCA
jgi:O-antigen/teichoic acid export membrane protein